jgi:hypothetical protein
MSEDVEKLPCSLQICKLASAVGRFCGRIFGYDVNPDSPSLVLIT